MNLEKKIIENEKIFLVENYFQKKSSNFFFENDFRSEIFFRFRFFFLSSSRDSGDSIGTVYRTVWVRKTSRLPLANIFFTFLGFGRVT